MTFREFLRLIKQQIWLLLGVSLLCAAVAFFVMRNERVQYTSHATVYTGILSGYNLADDQRIDIHQVNSRFDNIIGSIESRETAESVAMRLIAHYLVYPDSVRRQLMPVTRQRFSEHLAVPTQRSLLAPSDRSPTVEATVRRIRSLAQDSRAPDLHELLYGDNSSPFGISGIRGDLQASRIGNSDLIEIEYGSPDPFLTKLTLDLLLDTFISRYENLRQNQVNSVVSYFENKVQEASQNLQENVDELRRFRTQEGIVNYDEQTEALALEREDAASLLHEERSRLRAARNALQTLEQRLSINSEILQRNDEVLSIRKQLSTLSAQQAIRSARGEQVPPRLQRRLDSLRQELRTRIREVYQLNTSTEGLQRENVLNEWLSKVIAVTEGQARVRTFEERMQEYRQRYRNLAPLGATLGNLEREVNIAENEYLDLLRSLNNARVQQQNVRMTTNLNVVDPPFIPENFTQGNRLLVVLVAGIGSFFLVLGLLVLANVLDSTIRTPARAEELTGLHVAAAYPLMSEADKAPIPKGRIFGMLDAQLLRTVQLSLMRSADSARSLSRIGRSHAEESSDSILPVEKEPLTLVLVASTQPAEGKTFVAKRLARSLNRSDSPTLLLTPHPVSDPPGGVKSANYPHDAPLEMYDDLVDLFSTSAADELDTVVMELPDLTSRPLPLSLVQQSSAILVVARADRGWARTDAEALDALRVSTDVEPALVLNGVDLDYIEDMLGKIPDERSGVGGWFHRASRLEFKRPLPFASKSDRYSS